MSESDTERRKADIEQDESRDPIVEAGRIARGTTFQVGSSAHVRALVDELGGALASLMDEAHESPAMKTARALLARLEDQSDDETAWIATFGKVE